MDVCSTSVLYTLGYYMDEFYKGDSKMLARSHEYYESLGTPKPTSWGYFWKKTSL